MEAMLCVSHGGVPTRLHVHRPCKHEPKSKISAPAVVSTLSNSEKKPAAITERSAPLVDTTMTEYIDNWFDRLAIGHLSRNLQSITGKRNAKKGYDGLIEASSVVARNYCPSDQQRIASCNLEKTVPEPFLAIIRSLLPQSRFSRELFAAFTTVFFSWLVGPCEVKETELDGKIEKSVVYIKKCRFLEGTNCVSVCTNQCKMPSQKFIKEKLNMPVNMVPNFEDMSCEMIFGQDPPAEDVDPALKQPCYHGLCKARQTYNVDCSITGK